MGKYDLRLRPIHYASVSGGKDSLYMMKVILENPNKYPLDMVVHFELEIDWDFVKNVVNDIEKMCIARGIKFVRIKPRKTWMELYEKYDMPLRTTKWCNGMYKNDCKKQLNEWIAEQNCRPVAYIGLCADETKRFKYEIGDWEKQDVCYPLAEEGINEVDILRWARGVPQFNNWYHVFQRQGCWLYPNLTYMEIAYLCKYYPENYAKYKEYVTEYENKYEKPFFSCYSWGKDIFPRIETKWLRKLNETEEKASMGIFNDKFRGRKEDVV